LDSFSKQRDLYSIPFTAFDMLKQLVEEEITRPGSFNVIRSTETWIAFMRYPTNNPTPLMQREAPANLIAFHDEGIPPSLDRATGFTLPPVTVRDMRELLYKGNFTTELLLWADATFQQARSLNFDGVRGSTATEAYGYSNWRTFGDIFQLPSAIDMCRQIVTTLQLAAGIINTGCHRLWWSGMQDLIAISPKTNELVRCQVATSKLLLIGTEQVAGDEISQLFRGVGTNSHGCGRVLEC
jgi:hypothetical protein